MATKKPAITRYCQSGLPRNRNVDLLFGEDTVPGTFEPDDWHAELDRFISEH